MQLQTVETISQLPGPAGMLADPGADGAGEYLAFRLRGQEYAADILDVQEIRHFEQPTRMLGAADFVLGVQNLRGAIVPILDLRLRLGLPASYDSQTVTVLLNLAAGTVGLVVDSVSDVVTLAGEDIQPMPALNDSADVRLFQGLASTCQGELARTLVLVNFEALLPAGKPLSKLSVE